MRVIVCGAGQVGSTIARSLATEGMHVTVIDTSQELARKAGESYDVIGFTGNAAHPDVLERAGAMNADLLIAVTQSDEVNMVACQVAYSLFGVKRRIARLRHAGYLVPGWRGLYAADHLPIDIIISPEIEIAEGIVRRLKTPGAFDVVPMADGRVHLLGIHCNSVGCSFVGQNYHELSERGPSSGMVIVAVVREERAFIPDRNDQFQLGDDVYVIAPTEHLPKVMEAFGHQEAMSQHLVIVGGGNVGVHLARKLRDNGGANIKIIEHSPVRAQEIAQELGEDALVINGDALDRAVLDEANVGAAGTIVAVTNDDETNIFSSVLAKRAGCQRAITLVNKRSYEPFMTTLGIDSVLSPSEMTISTVLRHVRGSNVSALYTLREGFGEVVEAEVGPSSPLLGGPLLELGLPAGMIIGAVVRDRQVIIPNGETQFEPGDHIVALVTYSDRRKAVALISGEAKVKLW